MSGERRDSSEEVGRAIAAMAATVSAPHELRERIAADRPPRPSGARRSMAVLVACAALVVAAVVGLLATGSDDDVPAPTVAAAAAVALRPSNAPAPAVDPRDRERLRASVGAIDFPSYRDYDGWRAAGARRARLAGRDVVSVAYRGRGHRIGYAIVDGRPLARPAGRVLEPDGKRLTVLRRDGTTIVTWRERGHTCVLASRSAPLRELLALAAWS